jgi:hypothetical protein
MPPRTSAASFHPGDAARIERLTVHWPSGGSETLRHVPADQRLMIRGRKARADWQNVRTPK